MNQNDYYIAFDENGTPYIEHGVFDNVKKTVSNVASTVSNAAKGVGRGVRKNHKYILKVFENGKNRYFYEQSEVDAYYRAKRAGIKNAAEYVQNKAKNVGTYANDMINKTKETVKSTADKVTGAAANKNVEIAKKNADDASRWAKMTERVHKENIANFKQNPTEANLARAKQSGQAVTKANQNVKNAKEAVNDAKTKAAWHPANIAKDIASEAKKSVDSAGDKVQQTAKDLIDTAKRKTGIKAKEDVVDAQSAVKQATRDYGRAERERREATKNGEPDSQGQKWYRTEEEAKRAGDAELAAVRAKNEIANRKDALRGAQSRYDDTLLGKAEKAASSAKDMVNKAKSAVKDTAEKATSSAKDMVDQAKAAAKSTVNKVNGTAKAISERNDKALEQMTAADKKYRQYLDSLGSRANDNAQLTEAEKQKKDKLYKELSGYQGLYELANKDYRELANRDTVQDMIDQAKDSVRNKPVSIMPTPSEKSSTKKTSYSEWSENDKDFDEKNYSKDNHVSDTDFYTFKRNDGKWVVLEEDMKWVLPDGVTGNDPGIKSALKQFSDHTSSAKAIGNENYTNSQWIDAVTDAIDEAADKVKKNK